MAKRDLEESQVGGINALYELQFSNDANDLIRHHRFVREWYKSRNDNREINHDFVRGNQYSTGEKNKYRDKRKSPITFNQVKTSERTILGHWIMNRYDSEFVANSPAKDDIAQVLEQLDTWEQDQQGDDMNDIELMRQAWAGGNSFQECFMDVQPGKKPVMKTYPQNPFAIYWDPASTRLITREDAWFVDRDSWMSYPVLLKSFPDSMKLIKERLNNVSDGDESYEDVKKYADRGHEERQTRNGEYLVTERFYKVPGKLYFAEVNGMRIDVDEEDVKSFKKEMPGVPLQIEEVDELWLAIACEDISTNTYLYNDRYHCQPRDPRTKEIIWPILEMVAESLAGEPQGFVDHERDPSKVVNQMMANIISSATHAAAAAMLIDPTAFISEPEAKLAARHHSDSDRSFQVKKGRVNDAMAPVPRAGVNADHQYALDYALSFLKEVTSTPPSMQGQEEKAGVSGVLNAQRIEQGQTQIQPLMKNYKLFSKQRTKLRYYYWRTYYTHEMIFRVLDKEVAKTSPYMTLNKKVPELDATGRWTGAIKKINDINAAIYDISIVESQKSPTYRMKQMQFIEGLSQSAYVQSDPGLAGALLAEAIRLSDAPSATKEELKRYSNLIQQAEQNLKAAEQAQAQLSTQGMELDIQAKMQGIAQTEAEQTTLPPEAVSPQSGQPQPAYAAPGGF